MGKLHHIIMLVAFGVLLAGSGCSTISGITGSNSSSPRPKIIRKVEIGNKWQVYQIEVALPSGMALPIVLQLNDGDKVDGFFYVVKGDNAVDFQITSNVSVYRSDLKNIPSGKPAADRFFFTASQAQGISYTLNLKHNAEGTQKTTNTVFMELIYPISAGPVFTPIEAK